MILYKTSQELHHMIKLINDNTQILGTYYRHRFDWLYVNSTNFNNTW